MPYCSAIPSGIDSVTNLRYFYQFVCIKEIKDFYIDLCRPQENLRKCCFVAIDPFFLCLNKLSVPYMSYG